MEHLIDSYMFPVRSEIQDSWFTQDIPSDANKESTFNPVRGNQVQSAATERVVAATLGNNDVKLALQKDKVSLEGGDAPAELLPKTRFTPGSMYNVFPKKKRTVLPVVDLGRMATVQEACQDSPTIPGHPPLLERSMSVPAVVSLRRLSEEPNQSTPKASEFPKSQVEETAQVLLQAARSESRLMKRSSSLMTRDLAPLIIPPISPKDQRMEQSASTDSGGQHQAMPPRVPPKSPRTESRASPRAPKSQHSGQSSVSTTHSSASSVSSSCSTAGRASPRLLNIPRRADSPLSRTSPRSGSVDVVSPESIWSKIFRLESPSRQKRSIDATEKRSPHRAEAPSVPTTAPLTHQRYASESSAITRGRLVRKDSLAFHDHGKTSVRSPSSARREPDLPVGFKATEAVHQVAEVELRSLRQQADEQVCNFEVLQAKDVALLSKELRSLDERCQYLQRTYQSLRQGRKSLHERMMSYLRSPHLTNFSRESILKHEEALAEIDSSIDDWIRKSELAENRRMRVRQKLLEHVAATLTLNPNGLAGPSNKVEEQTPPESPENSEGFCSNERRDVQSIKIYADAGVTALLAEIDREIGSMEVADQQSWG